MDAGPGRRRRSWPRKLPSIGFVVMMLAAVLVIGRGTTGGGATLPVVTRSSGTIVAAAARTAGGGWTVQSNGVVTPTDGAPYYGDPDMLALVRPIVGIAATPDKAGYWLVGSDGGVFAFGDAGFYGSTGQLALNRPIVGIAATPDEKGYWLVASDGGIFAFGDAGFYGSIAKLTLNEPIVGMAATPDGKGYWLVASDGGIFAIGDAGFYGSTGRLHLQRPIMGMAATPDGKGYWLVGFDGGVFAIGDANFYGSEAQTPAYAAAAVVSKGTGYDVVSTGGEWDPFGPPTTTTLTTTSTSSVPTSTTSTTTTTPPATTSCATQVRPEGDTAPIPCVEGNSLVDSTGAPLRLLGVDVSGTQDACIQDKGFGYGPMNASEAQSIAAWHANVARVALNEDCWLGINGDPSEYAGSIYQAAIEQWVHTLNDAGLVVILELFSAAPGTNPATGQWPMADADHSITFWSQVSAAFANDPSIMFDLFNEPFIGGFHPTQANWDCWLTGCTTSFTACTPTDNDPCRVVNYATAGMQQLVDAVRGSGAPQPIMVASLNWAGDPCGVQDTGGNGGKCDWVAHRPHDPDNQLVDSFHTYNWTACANAACWQKDVAAEAAVAPVVATEVGENDCSSSYMDSFMNWADQHNVSYLANSWEPPSPTDPTTCVPAPTINGSPGVNLRLLSNWSGAPSTVAPEGADFKAHLGALAAAG
jgi:hypothetical protein